MPGGLRAHRAPGAARLSPGGAPRWAAERGAAGSVCLRRRRKPWPGAVPRLPHYASGRAGAGWGRGAPPPGRAPGAGGAVRGTGERSLRARPGSEGRRAGRAAAPLALPGVGSVRCAVLCLASALKEHGDDDAAGSWFDVIDRIGASEAAVV